ncbi:ATP-grasp domain-containing protein [Marinimicrobium alkaliphilum]|uniref:hypothetical protein n=1 Tax=Marinimicrobium alkaliphilum TaxID=2202654 RepID=UPI000DB9C45E|nr:hypothetical protein [Marinimicrobium alkaliphilum]
MDNRVLVLDAAQRSALSVVRSLGRAGLTVYTADAKQKALAGCSRYSKTYLKTPSPEDEPNAFLQWLEDLLAETPFSMVLPVTEVTSQLLLMNQERFPSGVFYIFFSWRLLFSISLREDIIRSSLRRT